MTPIIGSTILEATVDTESFLCAIAAVIPHAGRKAESAHLYRLRLHLDHPDSMTVTASDGYSAAAARVSLIALHGDIAANPCIDISPADVAKIRAVFHKKKKADVDDEGLLQIRKAVEMHPEPAPDVADREETDTAAEPELVPVYYVHLSDVSGMIPGETLELPMLPPHEHAPNVPRMIARELGTATGMVESFGILPDLITRFTAAAKAYNTNLIASVADDESAMVVVRCGEDFIGVAHPQRYSELSLAAQRDWLLAWREQFASLPDPE